VWGPGITRQALRSPQSWGDIGRAGSHTLRSPQSWGGISHAAAHCSPHGDGRAGRAIHGNSDCTANSDGIANAPAAHSNTQGGCTADSDSIANAPAADSDSQSHRNGNTAARSAHTDPICAEPEQRATGDRAR
jgi:hypothetical protein